MKVSSIQNFNINPIQSPAFKGNVETNIFGTERDIFFSINDNIDSVKTDSRGRIEHIDFKKPLSIARAIKSLSITQNEELKNKLFDALYTEDKLFDMYVEINSVKDLENLEVKNLTGMGFFALAFETTDGDVIKVSTRKHFPYNRKPDFFDLPIKASGKKGRTYYYVEEKVSQNDITDEEIEQLINEIKQAGYRVEDYLLIHERADNKYGHPFKKNQFGRAKDGKVYLVDPGCAIKNKKPLVVKLAENIKKICSKRQ